MLRKIVESIGSGLKLQLGALVTKAVSEIIPCVVYSERLKWYRNGLTTAPHDNTVPTFVLLR
jgi:hypothetical protein